MLILISKSYIHFLSFSSFEFRKNTLEKIGDDYVIKSRTLTRTRARQLIENNDLELSIDNEYGQTYDTKDQAFKTECERIKKEGKRIKLLKLNKNGCDYSD